MLEFFFRSLLQGLNRKIGLRRAVSGQVFSYNVLRRKIYPTLPEPRTYVFTIVFNNSRPTGKVPNRQDHGSLSRGRPRFVRQQFISFEKKTLLHMVRRALSSCAPYTIYSTARLLHSVWDQIQILQNYLTTSRQEGRRSQVNKQLPQSPSPGYL